MRDAATSSALIAELRTVVGRRHVLTGTGRTRRYAEGYRTGSGLVAAVVRPGSLVEQWRVLKACVAADHIVIVQAANTGLTGGSTPDGVYSRPVVVISTTRIDRIVPICDGHQAVCLSGSTLDALENALKPLDREPHSVIGSSCIGASVVGGICNNSGGALVQRGPAYTEYAVFARVDNGGNVRLVNHLGLELGKTPEEILHTLDIGDIAQAPLTDRERPASSASTYASKVRDVDAASPARFNADPSRLFEASGSAGRIMVFAVRVDTFPRAVTTATFYIGSNATGELTAIRRRMLESFAGLPISAEYIHREAFDVAAVYGKDTVLAIRLLGTARLPLLFALKDRLDRAARNLPFLPRHLSDRLLQAAASVLPSHLPSRMRAFRESFEHHLILKVADGTIDETRALLSTMFPSETGAFFECSREEEQKAMLHRFAVAGAAVRFRAIHPTRISDVVALDIALRRDEPDWFEQLPPDIERDIVAKLYYGHFFCHVFHQDYLVRAGVDPLEIEHRMWRLLDARGARYPAEHNVGHLYPAAPELCAHYRRLDPTNALNPGIGQTSRARDWAN